MKAKDKEEGKVERNVVMTNGVAVDHLVPNASAHEVVSNAGAPLNGHLMFADWGHNNNKFYIVQGLKSGSNYYLWTRWGRVGVDGMNARAPWLSEQHLANEFHKKIREKTNKGYTQIEIEYEDAKGSKKDDTKKAKKNTKKQGSKLAAPVQDLMKFIFDMKLIEKSVVKVGYNVKKLPLGKLSKNTIMEGYSALKKIEAELNGKKDKQKLSDLSSEFYRYIPHDFQFQHMSNFIINSEEKLKEKLKLVESLSDIRIAAEIVSQVEDEDTDLNELDSRYKKMNCKIEPMTGKEKNYQNLLDTIEKLGVKYLKILDVFKIDREGESKKFKKNLGNVKLLWHGSRFSNWGGILSQGLRIAPPEAPASGYRFGKGIYFADTIEKSVPYTWYNLSDNTALLALWEVALGNTNNLYGSNYNASNLPKGKSSTFGVGRVGPTKEINIDGAMAQIGPFKDRKDKNCCGGYSEFIVYNVDQVQIKYLFKIKVH